jgi:hypothetical protein
LSAAENLGLSWIKLFLVGKTFVSSEFHDQKRKMPGNPKTRDVFPARKKFFSDITRLPVGDWDLSLTFLTVQGLFRYLLHSLSACCRAFLSVIKSFFLL